MTQEPIINLIKGTAKYFSIRFEEDGRHYFTTISRKRVSDFSKGSGMTVPEAIEIYITIPILKEEIVIISLN